MVADATGLRPLWRPQRNYCLMRPALGGKLCTKFAAYVQLAGREVVCERVFDLVTDSVTLSNRWSSRARSCQCLLNAATTVWLA